MKVDWSGHLQTNLTLTNLKQPKYAIKTHKEYQRSNGKKGVKEGKLPFFVDVSSLIIRRPKRS